MNTCPGEQAADILFVALAIAFTASVVVGAAYCLVKLRIKKLRAERGLYAPADSFLAIDERFNRRS